MAKNPHVGGFQEPLFLPPSNWKRPKELPDLRQARRVALDTEGKDDGLSAAKEIGRAHV